MRQPRRLSLRARAILAFGLTALLLAVALGTIAYLVTRQQLVDERQGAALRQAYTNARIVRTGLSAADVDVPRLLAGLQLNPGGAAFVHRGEDWFGSDLDIDRRDLPPEVRGVVASGHAAHQRVSLHAEPTLVVGVPIVEAEADYFQLVPFGDVDRRLSRLAVSVGLAGFVATVIAVGVGAATASRVLVPLRRIAEVARRIVRGDVDSRLRAGGDRDLAPLLSTFNEMLDQLRARIDREARFASEVAHEVRGPLASLAAAVEVVNRRREELPERAVLAVDAMHEQVASFNQLVLDLLEISRFDAGATELQVEPVELSVFARHALREAGCEDVPVRSAPDLPAVLVDRRRLHQILANLIENARLYAGGPRCVGIEANDVGARITVDDRGPGVPAVERAAIFERFARGAASNGPDAPRGSGLGLALVAQHVDLHGGRVWVEDAPRGGARFVVELPLRRP